MLDEEGGGEKMSRLKYISTFMVALIVGLVATAAVTAAASPIEKRIQVGNVFTITSKRGVAIVAEDGRTVKKNASLILTVEVTEVKEDGFKFKVKSGTINIEGAEFALIFGEGGARLRARGAFVGVRGEVQGGEVHLGGTAILRHGKIVLGLRGPLSVGDTLYWLRFLTSQSIPGST
jgi:hypothetical protein